MNLTALAFVLAFLVGCALCLLRKPIYGLMTYVLLFYLSPPDRWWGQMLPDGIRWTLIAAIVLFVSVLIHRPRPQKIRIVAQPFFWGFVFFVAWVAIQSFWAISPEMHSLLLGYYLKYIVAIYLIYRCVNSEENLRLFLWAHLLGCFYISWVAFTGMDGGRFDDFGGAGIGDANSGALTIVTAIAAAGSLFLAGSKKAKTAVIAIAPFLMNAIVATISRSGFLALATAGLAYNHFSTPKYRKWIAALSVAALVGFLALTNPVYWARIQSIKYQGEQVEGVDTGSKRLLLLEAQWKMFKRNPLGCGSRCTDVLSPEYLDEKQLNSGRRSSHNTFMTMLVDHGVPGGLAYLAMVGWVVVSIRRLHQSCANRHDDLPVFLPAVAAGLLAITVGDLFVQYPKLEIRFWLLTLVMCMLSMVRESDVERTPQQGGASR